MKIEFISYMGKYPVLCMGILTLNIDGKIITFGNGADYSSFWISGGSVHFDWDPTVLVGHWKFIEPFDFPDFLKGHEKELIDIFNENVDYGCCGGCI